MQGEKLNVELGQGKTRVMLCVAWHDILIPQDLSRWEKGRECVCVRERDKVRVMCGVSCVRVCAVMRCAVLFTR